MFGICPSILCCVLIGSLLYSFIFVVNISTCKATQKCIIIHRNSYNSICIGVWSVMVWMGHKWLWLSPLEPWFFLIEHKIYIIQLFLYRPIGLIRSKLTTLTPPLTIFFFNSNVMMMMSYETLGEHSRPCMLISLII